MAKRDKPVIVTFGARNALRSVLSALALLLTVVNGSILHCPPRLWQTDATQAILSAQDICGTSGQTSKSGHLGHACDHCLSGHCHITGWLAPGEMAATAPSLVRLTRDHTPEHPSPDRPSVAAYQACGPPVSI